MKKTITVMLCTLLLLMVFTSSFAEEETEGSGEQTAQAAPAAQQREYKSTKFKGMSKFERINTAEGEISSLRQEVNELKGQITSLRKEIEELKQKIGKQNQRSSEGEI